MQYLNIVLDGYKRLSLNHINHLEIAPQSKIQLILGTNGSGKSSVIKELTPLPGDKDDYLKGGYKLIELLHNNSHYFLKNTFAITGNKYSFIKNNEELNPGGTMTTYKELVKQEFNITQDVHNLMTGYDNFHSMSVAERRNWFTKISDADYTYAISYFQKLKDHHRMMVNDVKLTQSRVVQESEKLLQPEEEILYRKEIKTLNEMLVYLLETKTPVASHSRDVMTAIEQHDVRLQAATKELAINRNKFLNAEGFSSINDIDLAIIENQATVNSMSLEVAKLYEDIDKQQKTTAALKSANVASFSDIDQSIDAITAELVQVKSRIVLGLSMEQPTDAYRALLSVFDQLTDIFSQIDENGDKRYSRETYTEALERQKRIQAFISTGELQLADYLTKKKQLEHYRDHDQLECPKCQHKWNKGYSEAEYKEVSEKIDDIGDKLITLRQDAITQESHVERIRTYLELYRSYHAITQSWGVLKPFWDHLYTTSVIFNAPRQLNKLIETYKFDLQEAMKLEDIAKKLKETVELKEMLSKNQETSVMHLLEQAEQLNQNLYQLTQSLNSKKLYVKKLNDYRQHAMAIGSLGNTINDLLASRQQKVTELMTLSKRNALNQSIEAVQMELTKKEQLISKIDIQKALVQHLKMQIADSQAKADVLKLAVKELSPSEGLIAKGLTGFINHFVSQMNAFIKKVWTYPLVLIPIVPDEADSVDLDYRFSVMVNDDSVIGDVSRVSSGMKEIIDLAFRIVSMQYLRLSNAPIILDEFAKALDFTHREAANAMIRDIATNSNFSQIFMVSHYEESYGSFNNCDVIVLHDANIPVVRNGVYNKHVVIR